MLINTSHIKPKLLTNFSTLLFIIGLVWVYEFEAFSTTIPFIKYVYYAISFLFMLFALILYASDRIKITLIHRLVLLMIAVMFVSTFANNGSLVVFLKESLKFFIIFITFDVGYSSHARLFIRFGSNLCVAATIANTISAIVFPEAIFHDITGMGTIFLLGGDNTSVNLYIIAIMMESLNSYYRYGKLRYPFLSLANMGIFVFLRDIATGKLLFVILALAYLIQYRVTLKIMTPLVSVLLNVVFFSNEVIGMRSLPWSSNILDWLGRSRDLTSRTLLWDFSIGLIKNHRWLGVGCFSENWFNYTILNYTNLGLYNTGNPHNSYLTLVLTGGILLLIPFLLILWKTARCKTSSMETALLAIILLSIMLHGQVEGRDIPSIIAICDLVVLSSYPTYQPSLVENSSFPEDSSSDKDHLSPEGSLSSDYQAKHFAK